MALRGWRAQFENRTATDATVLWAALIAAKKSSSVQAAFLVEHQVAVGVGSVRAALEAVQHLLRPGVAPRFRRTQLKNRSAIRIDSLITNSVAPTVISRAIEVAVGVKHQIAHRQVAVFPALKAVQDRVGPSASLRLGWRHFVHRATADRSAQQETASGAAIASGSIKVVGGIYDQAPEGRCAVSVPVPLKRVEDRLVPSTALRCQLVHSPALINGVAGVAKRTPFRSGTIQIAVTVKDYAPDWNSAVGNTAESIENLLLPAGPGVCTESEQDAEQGQKPDRNAGMTPQGHKDKLR